MFGVGKYTQHHEDASNKVTAPAGVAVVSFTQRFLPGPAINPNILGQPARSHQWTHR